MVITGGNSGLGRETALNLAARGANLILACRDVPKAEKVADEIKRRSKRFWRRKTPAGNVHCMKLDLGDQKSIRAFAAEVELKFPQVCAASMPDSVRGTANTPPFPNPTHREVSWCCMLRTVYIVHNAPCSRSIAHLVHRVLHTRHTARCIFCTLHALHFMHNALCKHTLHKEQGALHTTQICTLNIRHTTHCFAHCILHICTMRCACYIFLGKTGQRCLSQDPKECCVTFAEKRFEPIWTL